LFKLDPNFEKCKNVESPELIFFGRKRQRNENTKIFFLKTLARQIGDFFSFLSGHPSSHFK